MQTLITSWRVALQGVSTFRTVNELVTSHKKKRPTIFQDILEFSIQTWGEENVRSNVYGPKSETNDFPVLNDDGTFESSLQASGVIAMLPPIEIGLIFIHPNWNVAAKKTINEKVREYLKEVADGV